MSVLGVADCGRVLGSAYLLRLSQTSAEVQPGRVVKALLQTWRSVGLRWTLVDLRWTQVASGGLRWTLVASAVPSGPPLAGGCRTFLWEGVEASVWPRRPSRGPPRL